VTDDSPLQAVRFLRLPGNPEGPRQLTFFEAPTCPFALERVYWLHDLREGEVRGHHAHRTLSQAFVAASGAFQIELDDGDRKNEYRLDRPDFALFLPPKLWRTVRVLREHSVLVVMASAPYDEADYIRDYGEFVRFARVLRP
jgi:hypothetical protein